MVVTEVSSWTIATTGFPCLRWDKYTSFLQCDIFGGLMRVEEIFWCTSCHVMKPLAQEPTGTCLISDWRHFLFNDADILHTTVNLMRVWLSSQIKRRRLMHNWSCFIAIKPEQRMTGYKARLILTLIWWPVLIFWISVKGINQPISPTHFERGFGGGVPVAPLIKYLSSLVPSGDMVPMPTILSSVTTCAR